MSLWNEIDDCLKDMERCRETALRFGRDMVLAEAEYYSAKSRAAFSLKEQGYPVTFIEMTVKGMSEVSRKLTDYHMAEIEYENARECVNVLKKKLSALNDEMQREWSAAGMRSI